MDGYHPKIGNGVALGLNALIVLSAIAIAMETVPSLPPALRAGLFGFEIVLLGVFTLEYLLRVICSPRPLKYIFSFWGLVDLLTILPAIALMTPQWQAVRAFRLIRLVRLLKLFRSSKALERLVFAFREVKGEMMIFSVVAGLMLYIASVGIYIFEHDAQPENFSSIPMSLWWAVASFTTVGYGDLVPITAGGRIFTTFVLFIGLGIIAVPSAIVTTALLEAETNIQKRKDDQSNAAETTKGD
nr:ion transporter [Aliiroseovarius subalbicans]